MASSIDEEGPELELALLLGAEESPLNDALRRGVERCGASETLLVGSAEDALAAMKRNPSIVFFHVASERLNGRRIERVLRAHSPKIPLIAFGPPISTPVAFRLASAGVAAYLQEPFVEQDVAACIEELALPEKRLVGTARLEVGLRDMKEAQRVLRLSMCAEALRQSGGSRRAAARVLGVDRRAVQKIAEELKETADVPAFVPPAARLDTVRGMARALRDAGAVAVPRGLRDVSGAKA
jgi:DNA-binding NtrC family response regulator